MVRRHARQLILVALGGALLAGCGGPTIVSNGADLDAAIAVWSDPWVAPTSATVAGPALGSDGHVSRLVARRETAYDDDVLTVARRELRLAENAGWRPTSSTCGDIVQVALAGPDDDPTVGLAELVVTPSGAGATASIRVATAHHLDSAWDVPDDVEASCVDGESTAFEPPPFSSPPLGDADASDDAAAEWSDEAADGDLIATVNADPALAALAVRLVEPRLEGGVNRRQAPATVLDVDATTLGEVADLLPGWQLTFAACGGSGPVRATFLRTIDDSPVVLAAEVRADGTTLRLTLPMTGGPSGDWLTELDDLNDSACLNAEVPGELHSLGTPAVLPSDLTPIAE